jgi:ElaB/YqjD/DUF883 family membrane-anchored ribosome-binding protein
MNEDPNARPIEADMKVLLDDANTLLHTAATLSGEKAAEMRQRGMQLVEEALQKSQNMYACAMASARNAVTSTDAYVHKNPWCAVATMAGVGLVAGLIVSRLAACDDPR